VTRGGAHSTQVEFLRSANRLGALPEDRSRVIGFRVVLGELPKTDPLPSSDPPAFTKMVSQEKYDWQADRKGAEPFFKGPIRFIRATLQGSGTPMMRHNHNPTLTWCPNGDLLTQWMSTRAEVGREKQFLASRLRAGADHWDRPSVFFKPPDRVLTGSSLFYDGKGRIIFTCGMGADASQLALVMFESMDNGATWSSPSFISPEHIRRRNQVVHGMIRTKEGYLLQPGDVSMNRGTTLYTSRDGGKTWSDPSAGQPKPDYVEGGTGSNIAGIHAGVVQLRDGSLMAFGREGNINDRMPKSISTDMGNTWTYSASEFPPISSGQRLVLLRLLEGPILFISFTDSFTKYRKHPKWPNVEGMIMRDEAGANRRVYGMYAALSFDEGKTWPVKKLITCGSDPKHASDRSKEGWDYIDMSETWPIKKPLSSEDLKGSWHSGPWGEWGFFMDDTHSEPYGYLAATQAPDGIIHLLSSSQHYQFNLAWLQQPMPSERK
jgi:hypothetical protein